MKVLVVEPEKEPYVKEISSGLSSLQKEVGGFIEAVYPFEDSVAIICIPLQSPHVPRYCHNCLRNPIAKLPYSSALAT